MKHTLDIGSYFDSNVLPFIQNCGIADWVYQCLGSFHLGFTLSSELQSLLTGIASGVVPDIEIIASLRALRGSEFSSRRTRKSAEGAACVRGAFSSGALAANLP